MKKIKAVIYARYSSHNQREESIEGQIRECQEFADKNEMTVIDEYIDRALSGKTDNRPSFQKLIKDSEKKQFEAVIMYTLDRFARNRYDSAIYKAKLKKNGVKIFYAKQPLPDTPEGIILESVLEGYAEYYSENLSRNVKRGMTENALQGIAMGQINLGYRIGKNRKYEIEPTSSKAVKIIFNLYADNKSISYIVNYLNNKGYKTAKGNEFNKNSLSKILKNEKYIGTYKYDGIVLENTIPKIIDKELFEKVQVMLNKNKKTKAKHKGKEEYLLTTKLFCGHCNSYMVGDSGTSKTGKLYRYYKCNCKNKCNKKPEKKEYIEDLIIETTIKEILTDENIMKITDKVIEIIEKEFKDNSNLLNLKDNLKDTNKKLKNLMSAIEQGIITTSTKTRLKELEKEKQDIEFKMYKEENKKPFLKKEHILYWLNSFKNGDVSNIEYKRQIIDTLINSVHIYDNVINKTRKVVIFFNLSDSNNKIKSSDTTDMVVHRRIELLIPP